MLKTVLAPCIKFLSSFVIIRLCIKYISLKMDLSNKDNIYFCIVKRLQSYHLLECWSIVLL